MNYCTECGKRLRLRIPDHDDRERHVCEDCGHIHYVNPRIIVCAIPAWGDRVLLCKRAIEPRYGTWTLPGGFMELGESTQEAAARETREEAGASIEVLELYSMFNVIHIDQVHLFFRASLHTPQYTAGVESLEVDLFREAEVPWDNIAFPAVAATLRQYFRDLREGAFRLRLADVRIDADNGRLIRPLNFIHDEA
ncbi:MAG: NUDIX hydrolase [Pseudohongiellaceae bacterium]